MSPIDRANHMKRQSRGWSNDMDGQAIARRLQIAEDLYSTWLALSKARRRPAPPNTRVESSEDRRNADGS